MLGTTESSCWFWSIRPRTHVWRAPGEPVGPVWDVLIPDALKTLMLPCRPACAKTPR